MRSNLSWLASGQLAGAKQNLASVTASRRLVCTGSLGRELINQHVTHNHRVTVAASELSVNFTFADRFILRQTVISRVTR